MGWKPGAIGSSWGTSWGFSMPQYFQGWELACHCGRQICSAAPMRAAFLDKLNALRHEWGKPLILTSARRCTWWNKQVGGSPKSQHLLGNAVDIRLDEDGSTKLVELIPKFFGPCGIGVAKNFVHVDDRGYEARWTY